VTDARTRALRSLIRLRKTEVDQTRSALASVMENEHAVAALVEVRIALIESERREASSGLASMDDFRLWLPAGMEAIAHAEEALRIARQASDQAREALMQANAALKAAEAIRDKWLEEAGQIRARREQADNDDLSRRGRIASARGAAVSG
jgi:flagellar protein FliJ